MRKQLCYLISIVGWFSIITQFILMLQNRTTSITESILRFFSFFTILTNILVAIYFTSKALNFHNRWFERIGFLTSLTVYISVVGLVYQIVLRSLWEPKGLQMAVDELLHSIIPTLVVLYWFMENQAKQVSFGSLYQWLFYPSAYLIWILARGYFSGFYPYFFLDISTLGWQKVGLYVSAILFLFLMLSFGFVALGKRLKTERK